MRNPSMKFQNLLLKFRTDGQAQSNMPFQLFQSWGHKNILMLRQLTFGVGGGKLLVESGKPIFVLLF